MKTLFVILLLSVPAFAQDVTPRPVEPVKVVFAAWEDASAADVEFRGLLLDKLRYVAVASSSERAHLECAIVVTPFAGAGVVTGYAAAVAVVAPIDKGHDRVKMWNGTGPSLEAVANQMAPEIDKFLKTLKNLNRGK